MCGSHGTLGVLSEVAFKVLPAPEAVVTLAFEGLDEAEAVEAMTAATATPYEVTGAAHVPAGLRSGPVTLLRVEGFAAQVDYRARALAQALARFGTARWDQGPGDWDFVRDARAFAGREGDVWRYSVRPTDGPKVAAALRGIAGSAEVVYDWAGGLVWALVPEHTYGREALRGIAGHATLMRAGREAKTRMGVFQPEAAAVARLEAGLRARFDPAGVLNPGRMAPGRMGSGSIGSAAPVAGVV
jgi:glycolate oxidase FAD binding subunit